MNRVMQIGCIVLLGACCVGLAATLIGPSRYYCPQPMRDPCVLGAQRRLPSGLSMQRSASHR